MPKSVKIIVPIAGLGIGVIAILAFVILTKAVFSEPFQVFGMGAGPDQPIAFPHDVHVGKVGAECTFCHRTAATSEAAGIPSIEQCMFCHKDLSQSGSSTSLLIEDADSGLNNSESAPLLELDSSELAKFIEVISSKKAIGLDSD